MEEKCIFRNWLWFYNLPYKSTEKAWLSIIIKHLIVKTRKLFVSKWKIKHKGGSTSTKSKHLVLSTESPLNRTMENYGKLNYTKLSYGKRDHNISSLYRQRIWINKTELDKHRCYESSLCALCAPLCFSLTLCCVWDRWKTTVLLFHCHRALTDALSLQGGRRWGASSPLHHKPCLKQEDGGVRSGMETEEKHRPLQQIWNHLTLNTVFGIFLHK